MANPLVVTLGCRLNAFESEVMRREADAAGLDAVIVNTCAVTGEAVRQARQTIRKLRRQHPDRRIIVAGCAAQLAPRSFADMPEVDRVLGNAEAAWRATRGRRRSGRRLRHHAGASDGGSSAGRLRGAGARLRRGSAGMRPPLHLLRHPVRARAEPQRAGGAGDGAGAPAGRERLPRGRADRRRYLLMGRRPPGRPTLGALGQAILAQVPSCRASALTPRPGGHRRGGCFARWRRSRG